MIRCPTCGSTNLTDGFPILVSEEPNLLDVSTWCGLCDELVSTRTTTQAQLDHEAAWEPR